jgi:hypothetical protein
MVLGYGDAGLLTELVDRRTVNLRKFLSELVSNTTTTTTTTTIPPPAVRCRERPRVRGRKGYNLPKRVLYKGRVSSRVDRLGGIHPRKGQENSRLLLLPTVK